MTDMGSPPQSAQATSRDSAVGAEGGRRPVVQADVAKLLGRYRAALELAAGPPPSRRTPSATLTALLCRARPKWGLQRMVVEHIRGRIALIDSRYCMRLALREDDPNDAEDRAALSQFAESLPRPRSKFWVALPLLAIIAVAQALVALLHQYQEQVKPGDTTLAKITNRLIAAASLDPTQINDTLTQLLQSDPRVTGLAIGILTLSAYLVWRPLLPAVRLRRMILGMPGAIGTRAARSELGERAQRLGVHDEEVALFTALGMRPPSDTALDLWVKGALVAILVGLAATAFAPPSDATAGLFLLALALMRLAWLARHWRRRTLHPDLVTPHVAGAKRG